LDSIRQPGEIVKGILNAFEIAGGFSGGRYRPELAEFSSLDGNTAQKTVLSTPDFMLFLRTLPGHLYKKNKRD